MTTDTLTPEAMLKEGMVNPDMANQGMANGMMNPAAMQDAMMQDAVMKDIHDIRPPVMVGIDPQVVTLCIWVAAGLVAAVLICLLVRRLLKKRKTKSQLPALPVIPPYEAALSSLERLAPGDSVPTAKDFYFELGRILKNYLGATWGIHCVEMTTQELGQQLRSVAGLPPALKSDIAAFQDLCDPFRYAPDMMPEQTRMEQDLQKGRQLIEAVEAAKVRADAGTKTADTRNTGAAAAGEVA